MDGLGSHHTDLFLEQCAEGAVDGLFLVPHASNQTQPLDLLIFALTKPRYSASKFQRLTNPQSNQVVRILGAWFAASGPHHNVEVFMNLSLFPLKASNDIFLIVDREKARRVRGWPRTSDEIPSVQLPPEAQRRTHLPMGLEINWSPEKYHRDIVGKGRKIAGLSSHKWGERKRLRDGEALLGGSAERTRKIA
jgi:hypothetical protein